MGMGMGNSGLLGIRRKRGAIQVVVSSHCLRLVDSRFGRNNPDRMCNWKYGKSPAGPGCFLDMWHDGWLLCSLGLGRSSLEGTVGNRVLLF